MKRTKLFIIATLCMFIFVGCTGANETKDSTKETVHNVDSISAASKVVFYPDSSLEGQELIDAIEARTGAVAIATTNDDGTPNIATIIPGVADENTLMFGSTENQTKLNIDQRKLAVLSFYIYKPDAEEKSERNAGARLILKLVEDDSKLEELRTKTEAGEETIFMEIVKVLPIG